MFFGWFEPCTDPLTRLSKLLLRIHTHPMTLILASSSASRQTMFRNAQLDFQVEPARVDEDTITTSLLAEEFSPRDIADALAEAKAIRVVQKHPSAFVVASDQVLALGADLFSKPKDRAEAKTHLLRLQGKRHSLFSAAVCFEDGKPIWRSIGEAKLTMHPMTEVEIDGYLNRAWPDVKGCVGAYQAEGFGARLFSRIEGDWYSVLGFPLLSLGIISQSNIFLAPSDSVI